MTDTRPDPLTALREAVMSLPTHTRRNGFATPTSWVTRRDVLRLIDRALAARQPGETERPWDSICKCGLAKSYHPRLADHEYEPRYPSDTAQEPER